MASTLTAGNALNIVAKRYPRLTTEDVGARFADEVQSYIWYRWPWRQSLIELPPFHPVLEEPDYGPPVYCVPSDFYALHAAWIRNSYQQVYPLTCTRDLGISNAAGLPTAISHQPERASFRLHPRPNVTAPEWWITGVYKKRPTKLTNANVNSALLPWDDLYFMVFRQGLIWKVKMDLEGSPDADAALARFQWAVDQMAVAEGLHSGVLIVAPEVGLELGG